MTITGTLLIDVGPACDEMGLAFGRVAAGLVRAPYPLPYVPVVLNIGDIRNLAQPGPLIELLRPARSVQVIGTDLAGVESVVKALRTAMLQGVA